MTLPALRNADSPATEGPAALADGAEHVGEIASQLSLRIYDDLAAVEGEWRRFERRADCTAFQTFDWLATWYRHVGVRQGVRVAISVGCFADGETALLLPLCVAPQRFARRLCWLGQDLCDYNAPLMARDFSNRVTPGRFLAAWRDLQKQMQHDPLLRHDWIEFEKMPQKVGGQINPFTYLGVTPNASGAHLTRLTETWEEFYLAKRSSATRRRDRTKHKHLSAFGDVRFVTVADVDDARSTLEILMEQKSRALVRKGIADIFARPGYREFYLDLASDANARRLIHVSRIEIGAACAAANLGIVFGDCYYHVLASFADGDVARYGPGTLHLRELMAHAIRLGLKRFDFTIGDEPYKMEWSDTDLKLYDCVETVTWCGLPASSFSRLRRRIKRVIKQTPLLWRLACRLRPAIGTISRLWRRRNRALPSPL